MAKAITEEDKDTIEQWYKDAKNVTPSTVGKFIAGLVQDYSHDYGTICHACAASAIAGAYAANSNPKQGGITGFQAGAVMWEFINHWGAVGDGPKKIVQYADMLYPQYADKFKKLSITKSTMAWLQEQAKERLAKYSPEASSDHLKEHLEPIAEGKPPFGFEVGDD